MMSAPFDINLVIDRLRAEVPELQSVEGVAEYGAVTSLRDFRTPCAFALLVRERADGDEPKPARGTQRLLVTFGVVLVVSNYRDTRGGEVVDELKPLKEKVRGALMGWQPDVLGARPCRFIQGDVLDYDASTLLWTDVYQTQQIIGGAP
ncbi:TPA: hypothetical protein SLV86_001316 [Pseudomonas aeruginosa]|nr:hypothetical protein [Pseudomonas aeruginosa]HEJ2039562.1 hypothetical protein [Pseudomonas aeruginosa]